MWLTGRDFAVFSVLMLVFACGCGQQAVKTYASTTTLPKAAEEATKVSTTVKATTVRTTAASSTEVAVSSDLTSKTSLSPTTLQPTSTLVGECADDIDCPEAFNSGRYCWKVGDYWNGDEKSVYMDEVKYVCSDAGTTRARCVEVRRRVPLDRCISSGCFEGDCYDTQCFNQRLDDGEEDIDCGGVCPNCSVKEHVECYNDCDCLSRESQLTGRYYRSCQLDQLSASELVAEGKCRDYTIYQDLVSYKCMDPGTVRSYCKRKTDQQLITASCRDKNCTLDCRFKTSAYPNLAVINNINTSFTSVE